MATPLSPWWVIAKTMGLLVLTVFSLWAASQLLPPPKGQGLALVAVPIYGLGYGMLASLVYLLVGFFRKTKEALAFWLAAGTLIGWNFLLFSLI